jgi:hypothetical protein
MMVAFKMILMKADPQPEILKDPIIILSPQIQQLVNTHKIYQKCLSQKKRKK